VWKAKGAEILAKIQAARAKLASPPLPIL